MSSEGRQVTIGGVGLGTLPEWFVERRGILLRTLSIAVGLALWQVYAQGQPAYVFPTLDAIFSILLRQIQEFGLLQAMVRSLGTLAAGYVLAVVVGITIGLAMGLDERLAATLNPYINAMYVAPVAALVPVIIYIGGTSFVSRGFVVFLFAVFEIIVNTYQGIETAPQGLQQAARSFGANERYIIRNVVIPHDLPYIFTGLRLSMGRALKGMIIAELLVEFTNLGRLIVHFKTTFQVAGVLSVVFLIMLLGIFFTRVISVIERRVVDWQSEVAL